MPVTSLRNDRYRFFFVLISAICADWKIIARIFFNGCPTVIQLGETSITVLLNKGLLKVQRLQKS